VDVRTLRAVPTAFVLRLRFEQAMAPLTAGLEESAAKEFGYGGYANAGHTQIGLTGGPLARRSASHSDG
jgi:hypothetical protein